MDNPDRRSHEIVVAQNHNNVWVNSGVDGSCIGRFSKAFGLDVHRTGSDQMNGAPECLYCTHGPTTQAEWLTFCEQMKEHHGITIDLNILNW